MSTTMWWKASFLENYSYEGHTKSNDYVYIIPIENKHTCTKPDIILSNWICCITFPQNPPFWSTYSSIVHPIASGELSDNIISSIPKLVSSHTWQCPIARCAAICPNITLQAPLISTQICACSIICWHFLVDCWENNEWCLCSSKLLPLTQTSSYTQSSTTKSTVKLLSFVRHSVTLTRWHNKMSLAANIDKRVCR
jgi:hypothetical protein